MLISIASAFRSIVSRRWQTGHSGSSVMAEPTYSLMQVRQKTCLQLDMMASSASSKHRRQVLISSIGISAILVVLDFCGNK